MDDLNHHDYYVARAECARQSAERAASPAIAKIHAEMARQYEHTAAGMVQKTMRRSDGGQAA